MTARAARHRLPAAQRSGQRLCADLRAGLRAVAQPHSHPSRAWPRLPQAARRHQVAPAGAGGVRRAPRRAGCLRLRRCRSGALARPGGADRLARRPGALAGLSRMTNAVESSITVIRSRRSMLRADAARERRRIRANESQNRTPDGWCISCEESRKPASSRATQVPRSASLWLRWRTGRDSNPRWLLHHARFPSVCLKPLGHLSSGARRPLL